jgi:tRNA (guanosine-2'-O-)-methyltransferase
VCERKGIAYPEIDENGTIVADASWWQQMQLTKKGMRNIERLAE